MVRRGGGYMRGDGEGYMTKSWLRFRERSCASRPITMGIFGCRFSCIFFASILSIAIKIINMQHAACNIRQTTLACNRWGVFSVQDWTGGGTGGGAGCGACWSAGSIRGWSFIYFSFADAASLQIYEPHEQHVSMRQLQLQLQLHFVAINIIMLRLLAPISPAPLSLSCPPHEPKQIINLR